MPVSRKGCRTRIALIQRRGYLHRVRSRTLSPAFKPPSTGFTRVATGHTRSNNFFFSFYFLTRGSNKLATRHDNLQYSRRWKIQSSREIRREKLLLPHRSSPLVVAFASFKNFQIVSSSLVNVRQLGKNILGYIQMSRN